MSLLDRILSFFRPNSNNTDNTILSISTHECENGCNRGKKKITQPVEVVPLPEVATEAPKPRATSARKKTQATTRKPRVPRKPKEE